MNNNPSIASLIFVGAMLCVGCGDSNDVQPYDECTPGTSDCDSDTSCFSISVDSTIAGMCTTPCANSSDCPFDTRGLQGQCIAFSGSPFTCFENCTSSADCAVGWACRTSAGTQTFPPICLPI